MSDSLEIKVAKQGVVIDTLKEELIKSNKINQSQDKLLTELLSQVKIMNESQNRMEKELKEYQKEQTIQQKINRDDIVTIKSSTDFLQSSQKKMDKKLNDFFETYDKKLEILEESVEKKEQRIALKIRNYVEESNKAYEVELEALKSIVEKIKERVDQNEEYFIHDTRKIIKKKDNKAMELWYKYGHVVFIIMALGWLLEQYVNLK